MAQEMTVREMVTALIAVEDMDATIRVRGKLGATLDLASVETDAESGDVIMEVAAD